MYKELRKSLESEKKDKSIFDIILYGSIVKGKEKAEDIDIAVIFLEGNLRERLDKIQKIKFKLNKINKRIDIKQAILKDFFSSSFFARSGILLEGYSLFNQRNFSEILGFKSYAFFWYDLSGLTHTQKVKFNYILSGRGEMEGVIKDLEGIRLVGGAVKIPIKNSLIFEEILISNNINYKRKDILEAL